MIASIYIPCPRYEKCMIQTNECEGISAAHRWAEMNITSWSGEDSLFNKHDSSVVGELTRLVTFDKQPLHIIIDAINYSAVS